MVGIPKLSVPAPKVLQQQLAQPMDPSPGLNCRGTGLVVIRVLSARSSGAKVLRRLCVFASLLSDQFPQSKIIMWHLRIGGSQHSVTNPDAGCRVSLMD